MSFNPDIFKERYEQFGPTGENSNGQWTKTEYDDWNRDYPSLHTALLEKPHDELTELQKCMICAIRNTCGAFNIYAITNDLHQRPGAKNDQCIDMYYRENIYLLARNGLFDFQRRNEC